MTTTCNPARKFPASLPLLLVAAMAGAFGTAAWAQVPVQQAVVGQSQPMDPPGRVARLNLVDGAVSFAPADGSSQWTPAQLNRPLTTGDRIWTDQRARSELHVGSTAVRMDEQTSLDFTALDDNVTQLRLAQGTVNVRVRTLFDGQRFEIDTPNLAVTVSQPGEYRLDVNPANNTTRIVVLSGAAQVYGDNGVPFALGNRQQSVFTGTQLSQVSLPGTQLADTFDAWSADRNRVEDQSVSARYIPREVPGYAQLDTYGDWSQDPSYGAVWIPRAVPANWAPYRVGHWSWVAPWGWTWIDDAPWGFAPFHYGRWAQVGPRWAWVPGRLAPRPVYAPALVAFVGGGSGGVNWNISIGGGSRPALGWFPLAPGEAWRPSYRASPRYVTQVNNNIVVNNTVNVTNVYRYQRAPAAVTAVSAADFAQGRPVRGNAALSAADLGRAHLVDGRRDIPQRPDARDQAPRPVASALPPAAVAARPVVNLGGDRRDDRRDGRQDDRRGGPDGRPNPRNDRDGRSGPQAVAPGTAPAAVPLVAGPAQATGTTPPGVRPANAGSSPERNAADASNRVQREQERQRQQNAQRGANGEESIGQRALREQAARDQAQKNGAPAVVRPPEQNSIEQAQRAQQQLQRDQQRQAHEQTRQADQQRRQAEESIGQRALHEQAARDQQQRQQQQQQQAARQQAEARHQQDQQQRQQAQQAQRQQQQEKAQEQAQQRAQQQFEQRAQQDEARQARGQQQRQQQGQRRETPDNKP